MLGVIADLLAAVIAILFPVFASYKALKASDPAQLAPWCIYWVVLSLFLLAESWTVFILGWLPFYSWIRLALLSYLVLPQTQGAKQLYFNYIAPFIEHHEHDIEAFISDAHEKATAAGLLYVKKLVDLVREKVLGLPPTSTQQAPPPESQGYGTGYAASLLSRFSIPSARMPSAPSTADIYSLLSSAIISTPNTTSSTKPISGTTATSSPQPTASTAEKLSFIATQRERLTQLLSALDREQTSLARDASINTTERENALEADIDARMNRIDPPRSTDTPQPTLGSTLGHRNRTKSEHSFENIDKDDLSDGPTASPATATPTPNDPTTAKTRRTTSGNWIPSSWWSGSGTASNTPSGTGTSAEAADTAGHGHGMTAGENVKEDRQKTQARSTGFDTGQ